MNRLEKENFQQALQPILVNRDHEKNLLSVCPHRDITAEISCIVVSSHTHTPVDYQAATEHCMTENEVLDKAIHNQSQSSYRLSTIENVLGNPTGEIETPSSLLVLTNGQSSFGSSEVLNKVAMKDAASRLHSKKIYVIPSSVHEVLLFPENGSISVQQFNELIDHINRTEVHPRDRLANRVMLYDSQSHRLVDAEKTLSEKNTTKAQLPSSEKKHHV